VGAAYDEAVELLGQLRELAAYRGEEAAFRRRVGEIREHYSRRTGLLRRMDEAGLPPSE
jgi:uncharacterized Zn finger protein